MQSELDFSLIPGNLLNHSMNLIAIHVQFATLWHKNIELYFGYRYFTLKHNFLP